jgi:hypothetical protein
MDRLSPSQMDQFRLGDRTRLADRTFGNQAAPSRWTDATAPIIGNDARIELVRAIHGDEAAEALVARVGAERDGHLTFREAGRAPSASLDNGDQEAALAALQAGRSLVSGRPVQAIVDFVGDRLGRHSGQRNAEAGRMLTSGEPLDVASTMRGIQARLEQDAAAAARLHTRAHAAGKSSAILVAGHSGDYTGMYDQPADDPYLLDDGEGEAYPFD